MKELSIEEKAKRYDEALEKARQLCAYPTTKPFISDLQDLFPELKESEDERIRKWLIGYFRQYKEDGMERYANGLKVESILAWLEKQGEQKSVDEVEPKFNLNDWVVTDKGDTVQIGAVNNGYYTLYNGMDFNMSYVDKCWRKWTIEDAKDGDVLMSDSNQPFIYNGAFTKLTVGAYCGLNVISAFNVSGCQEKCNWTENKNIKPATKEQRDLLFAKMKEAGYEWSADKKELIKL